MTSLGDATISRGLAHVGSKQHTPEDSDEDRFAAATLDFLLDEELHREVDNAVIVKIEAVHRSYAIDDYQL